MPSYSVRADYTTTYEIVIEAEDLLDAEEIAEELSLAECDQDGNPWNDVGCQSYQVYSIVKIEEDDDD